MYNILSWNSLGEALLIEGLSNAYYILSHHSQYLNLPLFIQNSGIHRIVTTFDLHIDPDKLQNQFFYCVKVA